MDQTMVNWILGVAGMLIGFFVRSLWQAVKDLQKEDKILANKVSNIQILVAGEYAKKDDFERLSKAIFTKLDRIEDKLDGKVDKGP